MTVVYFSSRAQADIRLIAERLAEESELKSSIFRSRLTDAVRSLSIFPERGRKRDDLNSGYRSMPVNPVAIVYRIAADIRGSRARDRRAPGLWHDLWRRLASG